MDKNEINEDYPTTNPVKGLSLTLYPIRGESQEEIVNRRRKKREMDNKSKTELLEGEILMEIIKKDIFCEQWREYDFGGRIYRIKEPMFLFVREGGSTHRVVDIYGIVHCVPAPGHHGCILRWESKDIDNPVKF